eukprot:COSAG02_NODE_7018_length_3224_cov_96.199360_1_plen_88_part_10
MRAVLAEIRDLLADPRLASCLNPAARLEYYSAQYTANVREWCFNSSSRSRPCGKVCGNTLAMYSARQRLVFARWAAQMTTDADVLAAV